MHLYTIQMLTLERSSESMSRDITMEGSRTFYTCKGVNMFMHNRSMESSRNFYTSASRHDTSPLSQMFTGTANICALASGRASSVVGSAGRTLAWVLWRLAVPGQVMPLLPVMQASVAGSPETVALE